MTCMLEELPPCLQRALECMQIVRRQAAATLNYADTLPNCLRIAYHDSSERYSTSPGGCVPMTLTCKMAGSDHTGLYAKQAPASMVQITVPSLLHVT